MLTKHTNSQIVVINAGGQYCHLIARRIRELGVQARISSPAEAVRELGTAKGIIISGGPSSVYAADAPIFPRELFDAGIPILGICYGHQVLAHRLGGVVKPGRTHEYGKATLYVIQGDSILAGLRKKETVWMSHGDEVVRIPPGFQLLAKSDSCRVATMGDNQRKFYGLQFHPEVTETPHGTDILRNFIFCICGSEKNWHVEELVSKLKTQIKTQVGDRHVLFFVSGGIDSTVAFTLCASALAPDRVLGVFVDTGFMRKHEKEEIKRLVVERRWKNIRIFEAADLFISALDGEANPERKRRIIGDCFLRVQEQVEKEINLSDGGWLLGQGTIYPDTIESGNSEKAAVIKTHHNRVPAIEKLIAEGRVIEPVKEFYKDEVRIIGRQLGLPEELVSKNPFPGPGLAVRCLCSESENPIQRSDSARRVALKYRLQAWDVPLQTVGVQGDYRSYSNLVILSGSAKLETYSEAARRITKEIRGTNRVAFLVSPADSRVLKNARVCRSFITKDRLDLLREVDHISHQMLTNAGLAADVWQFPVVSLPLTLKGGETIALRPVYSSDAMTARHANLPLDFIRRVDERLRKLKGVDMVLYDVTDKPPATIEWE